MKTKKIAMLAALLTLTAALFADGHDTTVYVTNSGKKYHTDGCNSLSKSKIPITLGEAVAAGYEPCSRCHPPTLDEDATPPVAAQTTALYRVNVAGLKSVFDADITKMLQAEVIECIDGDTVRVRIVNPPEGLKPVETIRMLGIDTPETVHPSKPVERFGKEASDFTKRVLAGKTVYLAFDWDLRDRYNRLLAYIYFGPKDCFNAGILTTGYAHAYLEYPFQFMDEFKYCEKLARDKKAGLWSE